MRKILTAAGAALIVASIAVPAHAQTRRTDSRAFEWSGTLASGATLHLHNLNGSVTVEPASGSNLEIVASKTWRRGDPADVRIEANRDGRNVVVCAIWDDADAQCTEDGVRSTRRRSNRNNDTRVDFSVRVPRGANVSVRTTNGDLVIGGTSGDVRAFTTNGSVTAETTDGAVEAGTTNGDIRVSMSRLPTGGASYATTNGTITLELAGQPSFNIDARTTNGSITSDFDVTVSGSLSPRRIRGRIGDGGPTISLSTTNGNIRIRSRGSPGNRAR